MRHRLNYGLDGLKLQVGQVKQTRKCFIMCHVGVDDNVIPSLIYPI